MEPEGMTVGVLGYHEDRIQEQGHQNSHPMEPGSLRAEPRGEVASHRPRDHGARDSRELNREARIRSDLPAQENLQEENLEQSDHEVGENGDEHQTYRQTKHDSGVPADQEPSHFENDAEGVVLVKNRRIRASWQGHRNIGE